MSDAAYRTFIEPLSIESENDNVLKGLLERRAITYLDEENNILLLDADYYNENGITTDLEVICV